jgi:sugar phosphate permease
MRHTLDSIKPLGTGRLFLLATLTGGHTAIHWFQQLFPVILPEIKADLGLNDVQVGGLSTARQALGGVLTLPSGFLADSFRSWIPLVLGISLFFSGLAYFLAGLSSGYIWVLLSLALVGVGSALWHPPALASLSLRFAERRGTAVAIHGVGASVGDTVGPLAVGLLLLFLSWRQLLQLHLVPALIAGLLVWKGLGKMYNQGGPRPSLHTYFKDVKILIGHPTVVMIIFASALMGMGRLSVLTFLPVYLKEQLGYSTFLVGFHITLLYMLGMVSQPVMGVISDKFGRRAVLAPGALWLGLLFGALVWAGPGMPLGLVIAAIGLCFYGLDNIATAAVMDVASPDVQATSMGVKSLLSHIVTMPSPIIAGLMISQFGIKSSFLYASALLLAATVVLLAIRMPRPSALRTSLA